MNSLLAGYSKLDVTPPLGCRLQGYYKTRYAEGVLDPLEVICLALRSDDATVVLTKIKRITLKLQAEDIISRFCIPAYEYKEKGARCDANL